MSATRKEVPTLREVALKASRAIKRKMPHFNRLVVEAKRELMSRAIDHAVMQLKPPTGVQLTGLELSIAALDYADAYANLEAVRRGYKPPMKSTSARKKALLRDLQDARKKHKP